VREVVIVDHDTLAVQVFRSLDATGAPVPAGDADIRAPAVRLERLDADRLRSLRATGDAVIDVSR
jgi:hypothetical protein